MGQTDKIFERSSESKLYDKANCVYNQLMWRYNKISDSGLNDSDTLKQVEYLCHICNSLIEIFSVKDFKAPTFEDLKEVINEDFIRKAETCVWNEVADCLEREELTHSIFEVLKEYQLEKNYERFLIIDAIKEFRDTLKVEKEEMQDYLEFMEEANTFKSIPQKEENIDDYLTICNKESIKNKLKELVDVKKHQHTACIIYALWELNYSKKDNGALWVRLLGGDKNEYNGIKGYIKTLKDYKDDLKHKIKNDKGKKLYDKVLKIMEKLKE